jgi:hypothetical protein
LWTKLVFSFGLGKGNILTQDSIIKSISFFCFLRMTFSKPKKKNWFDTSKKHKKKIRHSKKQKISNFKCNNKTQIQQQPSQIHLISDWKFSKLFFDISTRFLFSNSTNKNGIPQTTTKMITKTKPKS